MEKAGFEPAFFLLYIRLLLIIGPIWYNNTVMERCPSGLRSWSWKPVTPQGAVGSNPTLSATLESPLGYDIYPLYWITSKGGILMRYSYEFKRKAIELFYLNTKLWDTMVLSINLKGNHY